MYTRLITSLLFVSISSLFSAQELTVEKIWKNYEFVGASVDGFKSMKDGKHFTKLNSEEGENFITKHKFANYTGKGETLIPSDILLDGDKQLQVNDYFFNEDESKVLLTTETKSIYRRSFTAVYYLLDLKTKKLQALDDQLQPQSLAEYSPDGKKVSFIFENNIYIKDLETGMVSQLTSDGEKNKIINGTTDWVYEEEFALTKAYGWSFDSEHIAYLRFDESNVKDFTLTYYKGLYPDLYTFKYPKAGEDNSTVSCHILSLKDSKKTTVNLGDYEYIPRLMWSGTSNQLIVQTMNRHQNKLKYHLTELDASKTWATKIFFEEESKTYVEIDDNLLILKDGKTILRTSEMDGFNHIYKLQFDGKSEQITKGKWDVIEFLGINESNNQLFYTSAEKSSISKGIYSINLNGTDKKSISLETGHNDAEFSTGMKYFIKTYSNANTPAVTTLCNANGKELNVLEDNSKLASKLKTYQLSTKEFITINTPEATLNAWMMKPADFDSTKKYPVYVNIYGGPGHNTVLDMFEGFNYMYHQLLTQKGYIVVSVDPRGTMYRGADFKKSTYLKLGKFETEDFIASAKELGKLDYVDAERIGIQGWSYGGFMTSLAMTKGEGTFKMGIAVAPVTNWRYYDNIYTERFMRTPQENASGYDNNSPINFVKNLEGKFFLIHGSADDNVHNQNTMEMINALVSADKQFDLFIYPNKNHGIYGGNTRNHLYNMLLTYTLNNL
jgi:dipeptidyl-peptidase-4